MPTETQSTAPAQHTEGPWTIEFDGPSLPIITGGKPWDVIAHVRSNRTEADARLIAAAPDTAAERDRLIEQNAALLAALEAIKARGEAWLASDHDYSTSYADRRDGDRAANTMLAIARDAIAKAGA